MIARHTFSALQYAFDARREGPAVVRMIGCADISAAATLASLEAQLRDDSEVVLNVAAMEFADTTFLRFLVRLRPFPHDEPRRHITLLGVTPHLRRVLEVTGLARFFSYAGYRS